MEECSWSLTRQIGYVGAGFFLLFLAAAAGRAISSYYSVENARIRRPQPVLPEANVFFSTLHIVAQSLHDQGVPPNYSFFVAGMQENGGDLRAVLRGGHAQRAGVQLFLVCREPDGVHRNAVLHAEVLGQGDDKHGNRW